MRRTQERIAKRALAVYDTALANCPYHAAWSFVGSRCTCRRRRANAEQILRRLGRGRS